MAFVLPLSGRPAPSLSPATREGEFSRQPPGTHERALLCQWTIFAPAELEPPLIESAVHAERDPDRSAVARQRFDEAARAVSSVLDGSDYLVGERFTVADGLAGSTLAFAERIGFADEFPANRALERTMSG
jgi:glutathione S-transferase